MFEKSKSLARSNKCDEVSIKVIKIWLKSYDFVESMLRITVHKLSLTPSALLKRNLSDPNYSKFLIQYFIGGRKIEELFTIVSNFINMC